MKTSTIAQAQSQSAKKPPHQHALAIKEANSQVPAKE